MTTNTFKSTTQRSTGRAILISTNGTGNFLAWTGTDSKKNLCFNFQPNDLKFSDGRISNDGLRCSNYGPDLVVLPNGNTAYIIWADKNKENIVKITKISRAKNTTSWAVDGDDVSVSNSKAASGPCAALGQQNGHLVLNVLWQDSGKNAIAFTQLPIGFGTSSVSTLDMESLQGNLKASSTPVIGMLDTRSSFFAYFDENKKFNLAIDPTGGLSFGSHQKIESITSFYGPAFVPIAPGQAYLFWADNHPDPLGGMTTDVRYQQIGTSAKSGAWFLNPKDECKGMISDSVVAGGPSVQVVNIENPDTKVLEKKFRVAWPIKNSTRTTPAFSEETIVYTTDVPISHAAMPVIIVTDK